MHNSILYIGRMYLSEQYSPNSAFATCAKRICGNFNFYLKMAFQTDWNVV